MLGDGGIEARTSHIQTVHSTFELYPNDKDGIRPHARRAQLMSSPSH